MDTNQIVIRSILILIWVGIGISASIKRKATLTELWGAIIVILISQFYN